MCLKTVGLMILFVSCFTGGFCGFDESIGNFTLMCLASENDRHNDSRYDDHRKKRHDDKNDHYVRII